MRQSTIVRRRSPLRRFREVFCFGVALALWLSTWAAIRSGLPGRRGLAALLVVGIGEAALLAALFLLEARHPRPAHARRWITLAWASLPLWVALQLLVAAVVRATS